MSKDIYQKAYDFKESLDNDPRILLLNKLEKEINENEEVMALAYQKDMASVKYSDILSHFSQESKETKQALKELSLAKEKLNSHPLVKEYLKIYGEVRDLYMEINKVLFSDFSINLCPKEKN